MNTLVWLITFTGKAGAQQQVVHMHNCIADYRLIDPRAEVQPIDVRAVAQLMKATKNYLKVRRGEADTDGLLTREDAIAQIRVALAEVEGVS